MAPRRTRVRVLLMVPVIGFALPLAGCSEELGPVPMPVARVSGTVREGSRPVGGGWIEFVPVNGTVGNLRSARLRDDGKFETDGVAVGENLIRLVNVRTESAPLAKLFGEFSTSPIRRVVPARPDGPITLDLIEEAIRFQEARGKSQGPARGSGAAGESR
jgi:hypothetical protein